MPRSIFHWPRTPTWCAVSALVVVLLAGAMTQQPFALKALVPSATDQTPVEESEGADEVVAATPRQRARCRLSVRTAPKPGTLAGPHFRSIGDLPSLPLPDAADRVAIVGRALPLRC